MTLAEALKAAKGEKEAINMTEFMQAVAGQQLSQYDKVFDTAMEKDYCDLDIALRALDSKATVLREWIQSAWSDIQDA